MYFPRTQQRSTLDNILLGVNTALNLAQFAKSWQNQSSLQEGREMENLAGRIKIGQSLAEMTGQPVGTQNIAAQAEKAGISWPKQTEEGLAGMMDASFRAKPPTTIDIQEGGQTVGKATPLAQAAGQERQARSLAEMVAPIGAPMPLTPKKKKLALVDYSGGVKTTELPSGVDQIMQLKKPEQEHWVFDATGKPVANLGSARPHFLPKPEKTAEQHEAEAAAKTKGRYGATPDIQEIDPDTGMTTRTFKRRPVYTKPEKGVTFITPEQAAEAQRQGKKLPTGTRVLKDADMEDYNKARGRANAQAKGQFDVTNAAEKKKMDEFIETQTQMEFNALRGKRGGKGETATAVLGGPPINLLREGHQTTFENGQIWSLKNGKAVRIK